MKWLVEMVGKRFGNGNFSPTELGKLQVQAVSVVYNIVGRAELMTDIVVQCGLWEVCFEVLQQPDKQQSYIIIFCILEELIGRTDCKLDRRKIEIVASLIMTTDHKDTLFDCMFNKDC